MVSLALELGSDVPFFIKSKPAIGKSRGEVLEFVRLDVEEPLLIVNPGINVSTKEAFSNLLELAYSPTDYVSVIKDGKLDYSSCRVHVKNDFEKSVFKKYPEIESVKKRMYANGALFSLMSGTGSTVYGFFENMESAEFAKSQMPESYFRFISTPQM
jgi:4-diphosphocytidyl-2-C-methyl-D-erythritol kinase